MPNTYSLPGSSRVHYSAIIGRRPEHRDWLRDENKSWLPVIIGENVVIQPYVTIDGGINVRTRIGDNTLILAKAHVGHDAVIGDGCELATGCVIGGHVVLGDRVKVGLNAVIRPGIVVGDDVRIGAGAVVTKDIPNGWTVAGVPAKQINVESFLYNKGLRDNAVGNVETCEFEVTWPGIFS